jgi:S-adenosylmethionine synthetase
LDPASSRLEKSCTSRTTETLSTHRCISATVAIFRKRTQKKKKKKQQQQQQQQKPRLTIVYCTCGSQTRTGTLLLVMRQEEECEAIDVKLAKAVAIGSNCGKRRSRRRRITVEDGGRLVISNPIQCSTKTGLSTCLQTENGVWNSKQAAASAVICVFFIEDLAQNLEAIDPTSGVYSTAAAAAILNWVLLD